MTTSRIEGMDRLLRKLTRLGADVPKVLEKSIRKQGNFVKGEAKLLCPSDTGYLHNHIYCKTKVQGHNITAIIFTNVEYAAYVEFGTGPVGQANHSGISPKVSPTYRQDGWSYMDDEGNYVHTKGQPAKPFMYPALKNNTTRVLQGIKSDLMGEIRRICNG